ncbi:MAG: DUF427 domain-containing protein [Acidimicrobiales bacterium]
MSDPTHTAWLEPSDTTWVVDYQGHEIARSDRAVLLHEVYGDRVLPPVVYFPPDAVTGAGLHATDHHTSCPIKGRASYYRVELGARSGPTNADRSVAELDNAVWYYPDPLADLAPIAGYVAFYPDRFEIHPG